MGEIILISQFFPLNHREDKHEHNFVIFSQATGQTWHHTSTYHLYELGLFCEKPITRSLDLTDGVGSYVFRDGK